MSSPFPGMDPYLEDPGGWVTFHNRLIGGLDEALSTSWGPDFFVAQQTAVYLIEPDGERHQPPIMPDVYPDRVEQRFLEIRDNRERRVIAVIEVVSLTNKEGSGARQFDCKRHETMTTPVHWLEIDLIRAGIRFPPAAGRSDYCVIQKHGDQPIGDEATEFLIWSIAVRNRLPTIAVPLTPAAPAVPVDLAAVMALAYARFYQGRVDYSGPPPPPPFAPDDAAWLAEQVRQWSA